jgi:hypothetical protein
MRREKKQADRQASAAMVAWMYDDLESQSSYLIAPKSRE